MEEFYGGCSVVGDFYAAEHLARLIVTMPELIAQTNMDQQSISRMREELTKLTTWMGRNSTDLFCAVYEPADEEYISKAKV